MSGVLSCKLLVHHQKMALHMKVFGGMFLNVFQKQVQT